MRSEEEIRKRIEELEKDRAKLETGYKNLMNEDPVTAMLGGYRERTTNLLCAMEHELRGLYFSLNEKYEIKHKANYKKRRYYV